MICEELSGSRNWQKPLGLIFAVLNSYCSAQDRCKELKLVWVEPTDHEDSKYVRKLFWHICEPNGNSKCPRTA
jgi:hypothetical protein